MLMPALLEPGVLERAQALRPCAAKHMGIDACTVKSA
jgi:hypothetical protein